MAKVVSTETSNERLVVPYETRNLSNKNVLIPSCSTLDCNSDLVNPSIVKRLITYLELDSRNLTAVLYGNPGTGKLESIKDATKSTNRKLRIVNCSPSLSIDTLVQNIVVNAEDKYILSEIATAVINNEVLCLIGPTRLNENGLPLIEQLLKHEALNLSSLGIQILIPDDFKIIIVATQSEYSIISGSTQFEYLNSRLCPRIDADSIPFNLTQLEDIPGPHNKAVTSQILANTKTKYDTLTTPFKLLQLIEWMACEKFEGYDKLDALLQNLSKKRVFLNPEKEAGISLVEDEIHHTTSTLNY